MAAGAEQSTVARRLGLFLLFLLCGISVILVWFPLSSILVPEIFVLAFAGISVLFLAVAILFRRREPLEQYWRVFFAFFLYSLAILLSNPPIITWAADLLGLSASSMDGIAMGTLLSTVLIVVPIILGTKLSGDTPASIFLKKGNLRLGLIVGLIAFLAFYGTSLTGTGGLFVGEEVPFERILSWTPWILAFVLLNGFREELWFRGLFLKKYESLLGPRTSNLLQAIIFMMAHIGVQYTTEILIFLPITLLLGLGFGLLMQKTDSLLGPVLFHAGADVPVIIAIFSGL